MNAQYDMVIRGAKVALWVPSRKAYHYEVTDVGIKNGQIAKIGAINENESGKNLNAKGLTLIPGLIDTQVHFRDPGFPEKETLASGTRGALLGGITGIFEMPNTKPATLTAIDIADKMTRAKNAAWCHYAFYVGASPTNLTLLAELETLPGTCGVKMFLGSSTGNLVVGGYENAKNVLLSGKRRVAVHSEDETILSERKKLLEQHTGDVKFHPEWRNEESAITSTKKICTLAKETKRKIHILHVTSAAEMEFLATEKETAPDGEKLVSVEVTPQHLTLSAPECYERLGTYAQMNPPIRTQKHQDALWAALHAGVVDVIGSDHAPHTRAEKNQTYPNTPSGMTGVQTTLPLMLNHVSKGRLSLDRVLDLLARRPCELFHIQNKGRIAEGYDADLVLIDEKAERTIENKWIQSACGWTPYDGMKVTGWVTATILNGKVVHRDGELIGGPQGRALQFSF